MDRASGYEPGGRRFESCRARHLNPVKSHHRGDTFSFYCDRPARRRAPVIRLRSGLTCGRRPESVARNVDDVRGSLARRAPHDGDAHVYTGPRKTLCKPIGENGSGSQQRRRQLKNPIWPVRRGSKTPTKRLRVCAERDPQLAARKRAPRMALPQEFVQTGRVRAECGTRTRRGWSVPSLSAYQQFHSISKNLEAAVPGVRATCASRQHPYTRVALRCYSASPPRPDVVHGGYARRQRVSVARVARASMARHQCRSGRDTSPPVNAGRPSSGR